MAIPNQKELEIIAARLKPFIARWLGEGAVVTGTGYAPSPHDLGGAHHSGVLRDDQAPQFLLINGTRNLTGNLGVNAGVLIDGVDISAFKASYDAHILDPNAHHLAFDGLGGDTGVAAPNGITFDIKIVGGGGIVTAASGNQVDVSMELPGTLDVGTFNSAVIGHTHAITASAAPGIASILLKTNTFGGLTLGTTGLIFDAVSDRLGVGVTPTQGRLHAGGGSNTVPAIYIDSPSNVNGSLVNLVTAAADVSALQIFQTGDTIPRLRLKNDRLEFGAGGLSAIDGVIRRISANTMGADDGLGGGYNWLVSGKQTIGASALGTSQLHVQSSTADHLRLAWDSLNYNTLRTTSGGTLEMISTGNMSLQTTGRFIIPSTNYAENLGAINRKWLTLHAAELWVETLVAQNTLATIGGRVLVGPTTTLTADIAAAAPVSPTFRASSLATTVATPGITLTPNKPTGTADGDLLIMHISGNGATTLTIPAGWTQIRNEVTGTLFSAIYWKIAAAEPASYTITGTGTISWAVEIQAWFNVNRANPIHMHAGQVNASSTTDNAPAITTLKNTVMVVGFFSSSNGTTMTPSGGATETVDQKTTAGSNNVTQESNYLLQSLAGAQTRGATLASASSNIGQVVAITPGSGQTSIAVKYNNLFPGDVVYMEAGGFIEFMSVVSGPTGTGPYTYVFQRDLDGSGSNSWNAGDAMFNTGQAGSGFIDLYSLAGVNPQQLDYIFNFNSAGSVFSVNHNLDSAGWGFWGDGANNAVNDAVYFGMANTAWNNLYAFYKTANNFAATVGLGAALEFWNGTAWTTFSPTLVAPVGGGGWGDVPGVWGWEWTLASLVNAGWTPTTVNGLIGYWVRYRLTSFTSGAITVGELSKRVYWKARGYGPTITMNVRNSSTYNDWTERTAMGNLNGLYGYGQDVYGFAAGKYAGNWMSVDETNGFRVINGQTVKGQWFADGSLVIGSLSPGFGAFAVDSLGNMSLRTGNVQKITAQTDGDLLLGTDTTAPGTTNLAVFSATQVYNSELVDIGDILIGQNGASQANMYWDKSANRLYFRGGTTTQAYVDTDGTITAGGGVVRLNGTGVNITNRLSASLLEAAPPTFNSVNWVFPATSTVMGAIEVKTNGTGPVGHSLNETYLQLRMPKVGTSSNFIVHESWNGHIWYTDVNASTGIVAGPRLQMVRVGGSNSTTLDQSNFKASSSFGAYATIGNHPTYGTSYAAFWRDGSDYSVLTEGTNLFLNAPSGAGIIYIRSANATRGAFDSNGRFYPGNQLSYYFTNTMSNGLGTNGDMSIGSSLAVSGGQGVLSIGSQGQNFNPTTANWTSGGTTLLLNAADYSSIGFHDSGSRVDFIRCGSGNMELGYNGGWGNASIQMDGFIAVGAAPLTNVKFFLKSQGSTGGDYAVWWNNSAAQNLFYVRNDGAGFLKAAAWTYGSDERMKEFVKPLAYGLKEILAMRAVGFDYIHGEKNQLGFIAQAMQKIIPELVEEMADGMLGLKVTGVIPVLVNALQETHAELNELRSELDELKAAVKKLLEK